MIEIEFPSGKKQEFQAGVSGIEIATAIATSLAKKAIAMKVNGKLVDLKTQLTTDASVTILTEEDPESLEIIRHSTSHLMAQAMKELYDVQVTIGPVIDNGFYYDFASDQTFSPENFATIEAKMHELAEAKQEITRDVWTRQQAIDYFEQNGEHYKVELTKRIPEGETISIYQQGNYVELCRGPHVPNTGCLKYFKLLKVAGAYWQGDSKNAMLQRIYGTAFGSQEALDAHLKMLAEAELRDHRKIGKDLDLFHFQEEAPGETFWHKNGWVLYKQLREYMGHKFEKFGYEEVETPILIDRTLWEKSGHWEKYHENMFIAESENRTLAVKPMSCPGHLQIFNSNLHSYRELPIRYAEFGIVHRNESSGALSGLTRVREFTQDDGHILCTEEQIMEEACGFCKMLFEVYGELGFNTDQITIKLSDRPEKRIGDDATWDKTEQALKDALGNMNLDYTLNKGEGAFYGPKLEFTLKDAIGRDWQCGTLQIDFFMPQRLEAFYVDKDGQKRNPVMLHRAALGSIERFLGVFIEHCMGNFPLWMSPIQAIVTGITNEVDGYVMEIYNFLHGKGLRIDKDLQNEKITHKIREYSLKKIPYILVAGEKEKASHSVSVRRFGSDAQEVMSLEALAEQLLANSKMPGNN